jgi:hypothetical protein
MEHLALAGFLIAHGLLHLALWVMPKPAENPPPFDPSHSWALESIHVAAGPTRTAGLALAWVAAAGFVAGGIAVAVGAPAWSTLAVLGAAAGLVLKALWFDRWLSVGIALDLAVIAVVAGGW